MTLLPFSLVLIVGQLSRCFRKLRRPGMGKEGQRGGKLYKIEVKSRRTRQLPNCKKTSNNNSVLVLVDYAPKTDTERPDFYVLTLDDRPPGLRFVPAGCFLKASRGTFFLTYKVSGGNELTGRLWAG